MEAHTVKIRLDTHCSFFNKKFQAYVEDYNNILIEHDIVKAISTNGVISGTTSILVGAENLSDKDTLKEKQIQNNNWSMGTTLIMMS